jgi:hypothetical protein
MNVRKEESEIDVRNQLIKHKEIMEKIRGKHPGKDRAFNDREPALFPK